MHTHYLTPPVFDVQPTNLAVTVTSNATFAPVISGALPMSFQWYFNGVALPGSTGGVRDGLKVLAELLAHAIHIARGGAH